MANDSVVTSLDNPAGFAREGEVFVRLHCTAGASLYLLCRSLARRAAWFGPDCLSVFCTSLIAPSNVW